MRFVTRMALGYGLVIALLAGVLVFLETTVRSAVRANRELAGASADLALVSSRQPALLEELRRTLLKYGVTADEGYAREARRLAGEFETSLGRLEGGEALAEVRVRWSEVRSGLEAVLDPARAAGAAAVDAAAGAPAAGGSVAGGERLPRALEASFGRLREAVAAAGEGFRRRVEETAERTSRRAAEARRLALWGGLGTVAVAVLVWLYLIRSLSASLGGLTRGTRRVAGGDFETRLEVRREDEFGELARAFNEMTHGLGELERLKRDFLSRISHDLKSPLASMQEATAVLLEGAAGELDDRQRRLLELSRRSGERLHGMISDLLEVARLEADAAELRLREHDLARVTEEATEALGPRLREKALELETSFPEGGLGLVGDRELLRRVLDNLLDNALQHTPRGGRIEVTLERTVRGGALLRVADTGPGVPAELREAIFRSFFQGERTVEEQNLWETAARPTDSGRRGVGLGLTFCREVVEAHGGTIGVEDRPGGGALFRVELPPRPAVASGGGDGASGGGDGDAGGGNGASGGGEAVGGGNGASGEGEAVGGKGDAADPGADGTTGSRTARSGSGPRVLLLGALLTAGATAAGCASSAFGHHYEAGEYEAALVAFRADTTLWTEEEVLYRVALMRATPGAAVYDPDRARAVLHRQLELHPRGSRRTDAERLLGLLDRLVAHRDSAAALRRRLEALKSIDLEPAPDDTSGRR